MKQVIYTIHTILVCDKPYWISTRFVLVAMKNMKWFILWNKMLLYLREIYYNIIYSLYYLSPIG